MTQEEKLNEAKRLYETANSDQKYVLESLFPELKESEGERIRKELIKFVKVNIADEERYIAWLEKQGEQKSAWSEEDENAVSVLRHIIKQSEKIDSNIYTKPVKEKLFDWLKSLKQRYTWKPSDKQMNALDSTLQYSQVSYNSSEHLNSLFNDLKKLREEEL